MQQIADWLPWAHRGLKAWHHCLLRCYRSRSASGIRRWLTAPRSSAGRRSRHCSINLRGLARRQPILLVFEDAHCHFPRATRSDHRAGAPKGALDLVGRSRSDGAAPARQPMMLRRPAGFIQPCLPSRTVRLPSGPLWIHEIKHDGYRLMVRRDGARVAASPRTAMTGRAASRRSSTLRCASRRPRS